MNPGAPHVLPPSFWATAAMIAAVVLSSTAGEVLTAAAMKSIGDLDEIRARSGLKGAIVAVLTCPLFFAGIFFMAVAFFALLFTLNHLNLGRQAVSQRECGPAALDGGCADLRRGVFSGALSTEIRGQGSGIRE